MYLFKSKIIYNFVKFEANKKDIYFPPSLLLLLLDSGSEIGVRGAGSEIGNPRSGIWIKMDKNQDPES
jgi:hypothetical protein